MNYRVYFCGVYPSLLPSGDDRHVYTCLYATRDDAAQAFDEEPSAYRVERWEQEISGWVGIGMVRDRLLSSKPVTATILAK